MAPDGVFIIFFLGISLILCTRDVHEMELQFLAHHLDLQECRQLVEALHHNALDLHKMPDGSGVEQNMTCIQLLERWNSVESRGESFTRLIHRLREMGKDELAEKVSRAVFQELETDVHNAMEKAEDLGGPDETIVIQQPRSPKDMQAAHIPDFDGRTEEEGWKLQLPDWTLGQSVLFIISSMFLVGIFGLWMFYCVPDCLAGLWRICRKSPRKNRDEAAQMLLNELDDPDV